MFCAIFSFPNKCGGGGEHDVCSGIKIVFGSSMNLDKMQCKFMCIYMFRHHVQNTIHLRLFLFYCKRTKNAVEIEKTISNDYDTVKLQRRSTQGRVW